MHNHQNVGMAATLINNERVNKIWIIRFVTVFFLICLIIPIKRKRFLLAFISQIDILFWSILITLWQNIIKTKQNKRAAQTVTIAFFSNDLIALHFQLYLRMFYYRRVRARPTHIFPPFYCHFVSVPIKM